MVVRGVVLVEEVGLVAAEAEESEAGLVKEEDLEQGAV